VRVGDGAVRCVGMLRGIQLEMEAQLVIQLTFVLVAPEQHAKPVAEPMEE
jgi:hypothetical protein